MTNISEDLKVRFINNECSDDELMLVDRWLSESNDNIRELLEYEDICMRTSQLAHDSSAKARVRNDIMRRIFDCRRQARRMEFRRRIIRYCAAAIVIGIIAAIGLWLLHPGETAMPEGRMLIATASDEVVELTLPDSSTVYLNKNSRLQYPETFSADGRKVTLTGEALFKVTPDKTVPFTVCGEYLTVQVTGTEFNFSTKQNANSSVSLLSGSVRVNSNNGREGLTLSPGQKAEYDIQNGQLTVRDADVAVDAVWHNRIIPFNNATIDDIASSLGQLYNVEFLLKNVNKTKTYSGVTIYFEDIDSTLHQLSNSLPVSFTHTGNKITVTQKD